MTLSEITDLVCIKAHRTDEQTRAEVAEYVRARYRMLWDSRPWRDALGMLSIPYADPSPQVRILPGIVWDSRPTLDTLGQIATPAIEFGRIMILPGIIDRVQGVRWGDRDLLRAEELSNLLFLAPERFHQSDKPAAFSLLSPSGVQRSPSNSKISISATSSASLSVSVRGLTGMDEVEESIKVNGTTPVSSQFVYDEILSLSKSSKETGLSVSRESDGAAMLALSPAETSRAFQRIHFHVEPQPEKSLLVLFKRRFRPLIHDEDATELTGIDNALIAAALADLLEGQRQFAKAQLKAQEASSLAQGMADLERNQSATGARIIPDMAGEEDWYGSFFE